MNLVTKEKLTHRHRKQTYGYQKGSGEALTNMATNVGKEIGNLEA